MIGVRCPVDIGVQLDALLVARIPPRQICPGEELSDITPIDDQPDDAVKDVHERALARTVEAEEQVDATWLELKVRKAPKVVDVDSSNHGLLLERLGIRVS